MAIFSRTKRVIYPLDDDAKARILGHSCISDQESPRLCDLVHGFLEEDELQIFCESDSDLSENSEIVSAGKANEEIVRMATSFLGSDPYRNILVAHVQRAVDAYSGFESHGKSVFRDKVASFLRELGHDAAVCVSKWSSSGKLTSGSYHFIDIDHKPTAVRYMVDLDFASQFEIARPTQQYARMLQLLPHIFVGKEETLRTIVRESCDAARRSLKTRGLSLPPWRRSSYLHHKWFGPYKRCVGSTLPLGVAPSNKDPVSCRSMGFGNAVNTRLFIKT